MIYKIVSCFDTITNKLIIETDLSRLTMEYLISYIQFSFHRITPEYGLTSNQISMIICELYGGNRVEESSEYIELDITEIWEKYCLGIKMILSMRFFEREELNTALQKIYVEILKPQL